MDDVVIGAEVLGPQERLLAQFDGSREEAEHGPQDRHLKEHREASAHGRHAGLAVQGHGLLLLFHGVFLLGILGVDLLHKGLEGRHLGAGRVALVGERQHHNLDGDGHQEDDEAKVGDSRVQPVKHGDDEVLGEQADDLTTQRNHFLVGVTVCLEALVIVGAEVELEGNVDALCAGGDIGPHACLAVHEVFSALGQEVDAEFTVAEVARSAHDGAEELLLEGEPLDVVVEAFLPLTAVADVARLAVFGEVVVETGILGFVLVALLHTGNDGVEVYVDASHVAGNEVTHSHEGHGLVH